MRIDINLISFSFIIISKQQQKDNENENPRVHTHTKESTNEKWNDEKKIKNKPKKLEDTCTAMGNEIIIHEWNKMQT